MYILLASCSHPIHMGGLSCCSLKCFEAVALGEAQVLLSQLRNTFLPLAMLLPPSQEHVRLRCDLNCQGLTLCSAVENILGKAAYNLRKEGPPSVVGSAMQEARCLRGANRGCLPEGAAQLGGTQHRSQRFKSVRSPRGSPLLDFPFSQASFSSLASICFRF